MRKGMYGRLLVVAAELEQLHGTAFAIAFLEDYYVEKAGLMRPALSVRFGSPAFGCVRGVQTPEILSRDSRVVHATVTHQKSEARASSMDESGSHPL